MATATAPTAAPSAAPNAPANSNGEKTTKRPQKLKYAETVTIPDGGLTEWPADFDPKKHQPLPKSIFADEAVWYDGRAAEYEEQAKQYREKAEMCRKFGDAEQRKDALRVAKLQKQLEELQASLASQGISMEDIAAISG